jgi:hypothetical protein
VVIRRRIVLATVLVVLFAVGWLAGRGSARAGDLYQNLDVFVEILQRVQENYVDPVEPEKLITGAMKGMLRDLDPSRGARASRRSGGRRRGRGSRGSAALPGLFDTFEGARAPARAPRSRGSRHACAGAASSRSSRASRAARRSPRASARCCSTGTAPRGRSPRRS